MDGKTLSDEEIKSLLFHYKDKDEYCDMVPPAQFWRALVTICALRKERDELRHKLEDKDDVIYAMDIDRYMQAKIIARLEGIKP
jgi:hypothetical protein